MNITQIQSKELNKILKRHQLKLILAHGSKVSGKIHSGSDLDIAVFSKKNINLLSLINDLCRVFKTEKIDITNLKTGNPLVLQNVSLNSRLLAGTKTDYTNFQLRALHRYNDYLPYFKKEEEFVKRRMVA